ncbi:MAG: leucine-rich repeat protein [Clostridia bacterium]|nr:leucine-rich repeat protein [Clostridia bacterium]
MGRIFISYSHKDCKTVERVNNFLTASRIFTWFDAESIHEGDRWESNISTAIFSCDVFLMFYSRNYRDSEYCNKEYNIMREKTHRPDIVAVDLDGSKDSFIEHDVKGYQFIDYKSGDIDDLCRKLVANRAVKKCSIIPDASRRGTECTHFLNALKNLKFSRHYSVLEPLIRFLVYIMNGENTGRFISSEANFSSLQAYSLDNDSFELMLQGDADFSDKKDVDVRNNYIRNLMSAMFRYARTEFCKTAATDLEFDGIFKTSNHRFPQLKTEKAEAWVTGEYLDEKVYSYINDELCSLYRQMPELNILIDRLGQLFEASKFYESLESRFGIVSPMPYEINPFILKISRTLFVFQNGISDFGNEDCFPDITLSERDISRTVLGVDELIKGYHDDIFLHGNYGSGKSFILRKWFIDDPDSFYIDLGRCGWAENGFLLHTSDAEDIYACSDIIRNFLERQEPLGYKINFYKLYNYSIHNKKLTIILDNIDNLSEDIRKQILAEVERLSRVFRIVLVSAKHDVEGKLSLNKNSNNLDHFLRCEILPIGKKQFVAFLREKKKHDGSVDDKIISEFESLDEKDAVFAFFDNFTKLDILFKAVSDWHGFSVAQLKKEFDAKIKVYQNIFESNQTYSLPKKIASLFQKSVVDIEDVIMDLVKSEIADIKKLSYNSDSLFIDISSAEKQLRFRDHYPILTRITGQYLFVNEDVRSYFMASYIHSQITGGNLRDDFAALQKLLSKVKNNYTVLEYLREFDVLSDIDTELLLNNPDGYEELVYILYKIVQYYNGDGIRTQQEFLRNANFTTIYDKFFFGAENIERVVVPPCVTEVGRAAFSNMPRLMEIDFAPRGVKAAEGKLLRIRPWAILNCPSLQKICFGNRNYGEYEYPLFSRCYALRRIEIGADNSAFTMLYDGQLLVSKDKKILYGAVNSLVGELTVPDGIEIIEENALSNLKNITSIVIPASVRSIATNFSDFCDNLETFKVDSQNELFFTDETGNIYTTDGGKKILFRVPSGLHGALRIPHDVNIIGSDSISCCIYLDEIFVPSSVRIIENYAFADTYSLKTLIFKDIESVDKFGTYIFLSTNDNVKVIGDRNYDLEEFNMEYCNPLTEVKQSGTLRRTVTADIFRQHGFEIIRDGNLQLRQNCRIVIVRDITLFKTGTYREQDFNILLLGLTEYNAILMMNTLQAEKYIKKLISENYIDMVVLSRNLPMISHFENTNYYDRLLIARTAGSSSATARELSKIIIELGEKNVQIEKGQKR